MKNSQEGTPFKLSTYEREDAFQTYMLNREVMMRKTRRRAQLNKYKPSIQNSFTILQHIKLNKGKKQTLQQQRNTEIQRCNRLLHQKIIKLQQRNIRHFSILEKSTSQNHHKKKKKTITPIFPTIENQYLFQNYKNSVRSAHTSKNKNFITLFMGHSSIDSQNFKIKIIITDNMYYLIAQNQYAKIFLQMPQDQYWKLHYNQLQQNPCNIFQYLKIYHGKISFRVKNKNHSKEKRKISKQKELIHKMEKKREKQQYSKCQNYNTEQK